MLALSLLFVAALPLSWLPLALLHAATGWPDGWLAWLLWPVLFLVLLVLGPWLLPPAARGLGRAVRPAAPADAFALGDVPKRRAAAGAFIMTGIS